LVVKAEINPVITIAPSTAVPSEEPSCCAVFWRPPASLRSRSSTEDWTTFPSWDTISPMPSPSTPIAIRKAVLSSSASTVSSRSRTATRAIASPTRTSGRAGNRLASAEPASAATKRPTEAGSIRTPVSSASNPWTICRKSGTMKKTPIRTRFWTTSIDTPLRSRGIESRLR
jgi:hypothetical protein